MQQDADYKKVGYGRVLLHSCCAICCAYPVSFLKEAGYDVNVYFYNPNIYPEIEYHKRLHAQRTLCAHFVTELICADYEPKEFYNVSKGFEDEPEKGLRCDRCFELRLEKTAQKAKELGINTFATSIVISPHKDFKKLTLIGESVAERHGLTYLAIDFKKKDGFLKSNKIAKDLNLYRQSYCGCEFSARPRVANSTSPI